MNLGKYRLILFLTVAMFFVSVLPTFAYWLWSPEGGKFVSSETQGQDQAEELYHYALSFKKEKKIDRAVEEFENLIRKYPTASIAPAAQYQVGLAYEESENYDKAFQAYKKLTESYPQNERIDEVVERLFKIGSLFLSGGKSKVMGVPLFSRVPKAIEIFEHIVKTAPYSTYGDQSQYQIGMAYKRLGQFKFAMEAFQKVISDYSTSSLVDDARYQLAESSYEFSRRATRDEHAMEEATENISAFLAKHPESSVTEKVQALKKEIENRDAEKNYRIALYYEKQNQLESAALYYEDVAKRFPNTEYEKEAAHKLEALREPIKGLHSEQREIVMDLDALTAKLKVLEEEHRALVGKGGAQAEVSKRKEELEQEIKLLRKKYESVVSNQWMRIKKREHALKRDESAWREKWKTFTLRRKEMRDNHAPELVHAFERWEQSLMEEKERLKRERETSAALRKELKGLAGDEVIFEKEMPKAPRKKHRFRIPFFGKHRKSVEDFVSAQATELEQLQTKRDLVFKQKTEYERELAEAMSRIVELEHEGFQVSRDQTWFRTLVASEGGNLSKQEGSLVARRDELNQLIREFETKKASFHHLYGEKKSEEWSLPASVTSLETASEFAASGLNLDEAIRQLQQDKAKASEAWMKQKELVDTVAHAFEKKEEPVLIKAPAEQSKAKKKEAPIPDQIRQMDEKSLRKRIKFLEREIRKRLDEVEDWNGQKDHAVTELVRLLHDRKKGSFLGKLTRPITAPARFSFWLARSMTFGLSYEDKKVIGQARSMAARNPNDSKVAQIKQLQEEIELESLMIQGKSYEIDQMTTELSPLMRQAKVENLEHRPIFLERKFLIGEESLRSADRIIPEENRQEILIEKLDQETRKLKAFENGLEQIDAKIGKLHAYQLKMRAEVEMRKADQTRKQKDENVELEAVPEMQPEQVKLEEEMRLLKEKIERGEEIYQSEKKKVEGMLYQLYVRKEAWKLTGNHLAPEEKKVADARIELEEKIQELQSKIAKSKESEKALIISEKNIYEERRKFYQRELKDLDESDARAKQLRSDLQEIEIDLRELEKALQT